MTELQICLLLVIGMFAGSIVGFVLGLLTVNRWRR